MTDVSLPVNINARRSSRAGVRCQKFLIYNHFIVKIALQQF